MDRRSKYYTTSYYSTGTTTTSGRSHSNQGNTYSIDRYVAATGDYMANLNVGHQSSGRSQAYGAARVDDFNRQFAQASRR
ncbi:hypothetical protein ACHAQA_003546 [Verticillium albo-atrum]